MSPLADGDRLGWGQPVDSYGVSSERSLDAVLSNPACARDLFGVYVLMALDTSRVRLVTSAALLQSLRRVDGPLGAAFATKALAAHVLSGRHPRISEAAAVDYVLLEAPLGTDDLLAGTTVLEEASVVDIHRNGIECGSYWPASVRLAPGRPTTADNLRTTLTEAVAGVARVPGARLALTAGRDSTLIARSLVGAGFALPAFTLGSPESPDAEGAARTAAAIGLEHRAVPVGARRAPDRFAEILRWAPWHEGTQRAWDYSASWMDWDVDDLFYIGGHGGEIGRGYYWKAGQRGEDITVLERRGGHLPPIASKAYAQRLADTAERLRGLGRPDTDLLDLFYARYRANFFFSRWAPHSQFRGFTMPFLEPSVVAALLDIPVDVRNGALFDEALRSLGAEPPPAAVATRAPRGLARAVARWRSSRFGGTRDAGWLVLDETLTEVGRPSLVTDIVGREWWLRTTALARGGAGYAFWRLWSALSIEALHRFLATTPVFRRDGGI